MIAGISDTTDNMRRFADTVRTGDRILIGGEPGTGKKLLAKKVMERNYPDVETPYIRTSFLENGSDGRIFEDTSHDIFITDSRSLFKEHRDRVVSAIWILPLRERVQDIPLLIEHFRDVHHSLDLTTWNKNRNMKKLLNYWWPFNVLELKRVLLSRRGKSMLPYEKVRDVIQHSSVSDIISMKLERFWDDIEYGLNPGGIYRLFMDASEKELIKSALIRCNGSKKDAADLLNIHRNTLTRKIKKLEIDTDDD